MITEEKSPWRSLPFRAGNEQKMNYAIQSMTTDFGKSVQNRETPEVIRGLEKVMPKVGF